ncbi:uncharacterized protein LOC111708786 [Eurytemora carolleeae]|uniref:uncharacterized protein LOC111708786 n=1 Tax=Eurytemora carolleeae TaxID=1294199 RepID=UPI000C78D2F2|nr:uncharacterized protein LOC111708786 [Eurytemora carolleeae]|eukprot:XP_023338043.1 uncharacterized protein LOC111708786 [Eurytemora affinis]
MRFNQYFSDMRAWCCILLVLGVEARDGGVLTRNIDGLFGGFREKTFSRFSRKDRNSRFSSKPLGENFGFTRNDRGGRDSSDEPRSGRFLNIFNIIKFANTGCGTGNSSSPNGTCYTSWECSARGGEEQGSCASGFGRCCVFTNSELRSTVDEPVSYFRNPGFPANSSPEANTRTLTVQVTDTNVCQVRIDFDKFVNSPQNRVGVCEEQYLTIQGVENIFCGNNTGQHVYVHVDSYPASIDLEFTSTSAMAASTFLFSLRVTQIDCYSKDESMRQLQAPKGCLQYFTEPAGTIQSFNYDGMNAYSPNQDYTICVKKETKDCGIKYMNPEYNSTLKMKRSVGKEKVQVACSSGAGSGTGSGTGTGTGTTASGCGDTCLDPTNGDWIAIPMGQLESSDTSVPSSYRSFYCGQGLGVDTNSTQPGVNGKGVRDFSGGPFQLWFHADGKTPLTDTTVADDTGFLISYAVQAGKCL